MRRLQFAQAKMEIVHEGFEQVDGRRHLLAGFFGRLDRDKGFLEGGHRAPVWSRLGQRLFDELQLADQLLVALLMHCHCVVLCLTTLVCPCLSTLTNRL
ncbi:hypothetical protein VCHA34P120_100193 [Vibrio chagasii]|nr:hypothetical protein VCHA34P120_100193 [Vibrio chagasii]